MAARRLLIVMLILLGISTLAAALVPQRTLNDDTTTARTNSTRTATASESQPPPRTLTLQLTVTPKKTLVMEGPVCAKAKPKCEPIHVGDQLTLLVYAKPAAQLEFKEFGQFQFAAPNAPARFELLPDAPGRFGIVFASTNRVAASVQVLTAAKARKATKSSGKKDAKRRARAGSGRA